MTTRTARRLRPTTQEASHLMPELDPLPGRAPAPTAPHAIALDRPRARARGRAFGLVLLALGSSALAACADDSADGSADAGATVPAASSETFEDMTGERHVTIQARDNTFVAEHVVISTGTEVTFDNRGRNPHNALPVEEGAFPEVATDDLQPGDEATVVFDEAGEYPYYCSLHGTETAGMIGTIRVTE